MNCTFGSLQSGNTCMPCKIQWDANADMVLQRLIEYIDKEILACHVKIQSDANADMVIQRVIEYIEKEYKVSHSHITVQIEREVDRIICIMIKPAFVNSDYNLFQFYWEL